MLPSYHIDECLELERRIAQHCCTSGGQSSQTAWELLQRQQEPQSDDANVVEQFQFDSKDSFNIVNQNQSSRISIPTGLMGLDQQLVPLHGLPMGSLTELVGPAGVGKSQLAFQLCLETILRGGGGSAIYIETEGKQQQALSRFHEMAQAQCTTLSPPEYPQLGQFLQQQQQQQALLEQNLEVVSPQSLEELIQTTMIQVEDMIYRRQEQAEDEDDQQGMNTGMWDTDDSHQENDWQYQRRRPVRLIVLDSIAAPFRRNHSRFHERSQALLQIAQALKRLAHQLNVCVVVINQAATSSFAADAPTHSDGTARFGNHHQGVVRSNDDDPTPSGEMKMSETKQEVDDLSIQAALGTTWYHCVSTRIQLGQSSCHSTTTTMAPSVNQPTTTSIAAVGLSQTRRFASIVKSNLIATPTVPVGYTITTSGLVRCEVPR